MLRVMILVLSLILTSGSLFAQGSPISREEFVQYLYELPKNPQRKERLIEQVRSRGIAFDLTSGMKSLVATKSGNDAVLRRTLEEAARRRANPTAATPVTEQEARTVLEKAKAATNQASSDMPDFVVKQLITRSYALGNSRNWRRADHLTIAVSYRASAGEQYRVLAVNGYPVGEEKENSTYEDLGGSTSTGEYVAMLAHLLSDQARARIEMVDTDQIRERKTIVYQFEVKREHSAYVIKTDGNNSIIAGYSGKIWIDRENHRILRLETNATEIPSDFPVRRASKVIEYDWVTISDKTYLLPVNANLELTSRFDSSLIEKRNEIRFRNYQKYGSEVKIIEVEDDLPEPEPQN
jgi:hypothetical protein